MPYLYLNTLQEAIAVRDALETLKTQDEVSRCTALNRIWTLILEMDPKATREGGHPEDRGPAVP